ncbi:hydantoinase B/oxoprolinase family protein [Novosphingobium mangrovi (ex Huang et al. 2023)]|uniref:Hydantoinase B/oxoprolinase family protein n=1 Tax=Novosphingobium mangrovi (ex Huang et al. 2023) TaxID=2976432 RepID=A0ABT2I1X6_9SPHN|nr:hydantoinase B/oxoprolinase family protein [Novosphingobium mangrovi (ex Huang et al. 2023)]MCT2398805.1 hydantoinase B/oxoprolinase family protein [Novosphingobium mangrovi (ex Huang et al. 2023)]
MSTDPFTREIIKDALVALGEEMFNAMIRTSMSPIIYETTDFAVGATDAQGNLLAQGNGVTGFLATLDTAVQSTLEHWPLDEIRPGDIFLTNSPYEGGGTHLSDVVILLPVFVDGRLIAWTVNKAHWTEVGGTYPGSATTASTDIFQEGLHFRFLKLYEKGKINAALVEMIRTNVRLPGSTIGDMHAGVAACRVGGRRIAELAEKYGVEDLLAAMDSLLDYGERMTREELKKLPKGVFTAEDVVEEDGHGNGPFVIKVKVTITDEKMVADFTGTSPQALGPINLSYAGLITGVRCTFKAVTNTEIPANGGCFRALEVICPEGTILSATSPAPVSIYYESLLGAIEVMWKALAPLMPHKLPVGHQRTVGATFISGLLPGSNELFVMGEPLVGGWGAGFDHDGDAGQFCAANGETFNIPVELAESRYGFEIDQYALHNEDGGAGEYRGGKGVVLDYRVTANEAFLTYSATRTTSRPWGLAGGQEGSTNRAEILRKDGTVETHSMVTGARAVEGEIFRLVSATGGGYGDPMKRDRDRLLADLRDGYVTPEQARRDYGFDPAA